jgi:cytochrome b pre-mRNA-processing protein 3
MLNALKRRAERRGVVDRLCKAVSDRSRAVVFFRDFAVADTIDGRFDLLALHVWFVLDEFRDRKTADIGQQFVDALFVQFDEALRDLGASDVGMSRRIKKMASALFGRLEAYRGAPHEAALTEAIARNVYRGAADGVEPARVLASYCMSARAHVNRSQLESGAIDFGPLPALAG